MSDESTSSAKPRGSRFLGLPASQIGRITASLSLVVVLSVLLMAVVVEPASPAWRDAYGVFVVATVVATALCGLIAVVARRERSWAVVVPSLLCIVIVLNEVAQRVAARR